MLDIIVTSYTKLEAKQFPRSGQSFLFLQLQLLSAFSFVLGEMIFLKINKDFCKTFKKRGLEIIVQCNMTIVNYLDVTIDLNSGLYQPYKKPNNEIK